MKMRHLITAALGVALSAQGAFALSCMRPDLIGTLEKAKASEKTYYILVGTFVPQDPNFKPQSSYRDPRSSEGGFIDGRPKPIPPTITPMWFEGYSLTNNENFDVPLTRFPVAVKTSCAGPWCSSPPTGNMTQIAFTEERPGQMPLLSVGPCPDMIFALNSNAPQIDRIRDCLDESCAPAGPEY